ncbi:hypothetical protein BGZ96_003956 [Linnemannia gamsii]|uniref:DUF6589 domain-containing protein n=1 Tax=Linnemannia gamsii TaxID=64522 RepID=A0ABQ7JIP3_9FUNG|nr:hypothetical protein BGZ96_003956 [Linnemannia gamsii]
MFTFEQAWGSVNENGDAIMVPSASSPLKRKRRTKERLKVDKTSQLLTVFAALAEQSLSMSDFLCNAFNSDEEFIKGKVSQFYSTGGPGRILRLWGQQLEETDNDEDLIAQAVQIVGDRVQTDLREASQETTLRCPANSITRKSLKKFSLDHIRRTLDASAPTLTLLLKAIIPRNKPAKGSVAGWQPRRVTTRQKKADTQVKPRARTPSDSDMENMTLRNSVPSPDFDQESDTDLPPPKESYLVDSGTDTDSNSEADEAAAMSEDEDIVDYEDEVNLNADVAISLEQQLDRDEGWADEPEPNADMDPRIHLRGLSAPKRLIKLLSAIGLSMAYTTTTSGLRSLASNHRFLMRTKAVRYPIVVIFDNVNRMRIQRHQRSNKRNHMESQTAGTIVIGKDLGEEREPQSDDRDPCVHNVALTTCDTDHFRVVYRSHIFNALQQNRIVNVNHQLTILFRIPDKTLLNVERSKAFELPLMDIDQATVAGNKEVLETIREALDKPKVEFTGLMLVGGDHLSVSRLHSLKERSIGELTPFDRMQWAIPVLQLFHMQMVLSSAILKNHYGSSSTPGSLAYYINTLGRRKLQQDKPCYHTNNEFLRIVFRAMVNQLWETRAASFKGDRLEDREVLININKIVSSCLANVETLATSNSTTNINALLFIKDMVVYIEFCTAIKTGDVGRIEEILKRITIMFHSGSNKNYGHELLRLNYNIRHKWSKSRKDAIFSSMLMNTKNSRNTFIPSDLYQEQNNLLIKRIHSTVGHSEKATSYMTPLVRLFRQINGIIAKEYQLPANPTFHRVTKMEGDIQIVMRSLREHNILDIETNTTKHSHHPFATSIVVDMMTEGFTRLVSGGYNAFLERLEEEKLGEMIAQDMNKLLEALDDEVEMAEKYLDQSFD